MLFKRVDKDKREREAFIKHRDALSKVHEEGWFRKFAIMPHRVSDNSYAALCWVELKGVEAEADRFSWGASYDGPILRYNDRHTGKVLCRIPDSDEFYTYSMDEFLYTSAGLCTTKLQTRDQIKEHTVMRWLFRAICTGAIGIPIFIAAVLIL